MTQLTTHHPRSGWKEEESRQREHSRAVFLMEMMQWKLFLMTRMERKNSLKIPAGQIQMVTDMWIRMEKN